MPRALPRSESAVFARSTCLCILLLLALACREQPSPAERAVGSVRPATFAKPERIRRPAPTGPFDCGELRPAPRTENATLPETIELVPPGAGKTVFFSRTGERVTFDRDTFLKAARCLDLKHSIRYVEEETGVEQQSPIIDSFQLNYVAAALLDAGRAGVRLEGEPESRKSILRDGWAADGCKGHCRSFGRMYRLSEDDPWSFLQVTDTPPNF